MVDDLLLLVSSLSVLVSSLVLLLSVVLTGLVERSNSQLIRLLNGIPLLNAMSEFLGNLPEQHYQSIEAGIPTWHTQFITLLENILPIEFPEEWLGDLREQHHQSIKEGKPPWKVGFITLFTGLGLILSYFWLESDKLVSRWMTRAKKVF